MKCIFSNNSKKTNFQNLYTLLEMRESGWLLCYTVCVESTSASHCHLFVKFEFKDKSLHKKNNSLKIWPILLAYNITNYIL